jgi:hypothetical protein
MVALSSVARRWIAWHAVLQDAPALHPAIIAAARRVADRIASRMT